jgi:hypothetical protein
MMVLLLDPAHMWTAETHCRSRHINPMCLKA